MSKKGCFKRREILDIIKKHPKILEFLKKAYPKLLEANPRRHTRVRSRQERRFDAFSRLIVGNETCASVGFDGVHLLVASNQTQAQNYRVKTTIKCIIVKGSRLRTGVRIRPVFHCQVNDLPPLPPVVGDEVLYTAHAVVDSDTGIITDIVIRTDEPFSGEFQILPEQHGIPDLPDIKIKFTLEQNLPAPSVFTVITQDTEVKTPFVFHTSVNRLQRAAEKLIEHLSFISRAKLHPNPDIRERALSLLNKSRFRVLADTLAWEAIKWYERAVGRSEAQKIIAIEALKPFLKSLTMHFERFFTASHTKPGATISSIVNAWADKVVNIIKHGGIPSCPDYIASNPEKFMSRTKRYFIDLEKLERFIIEEMDQETHPFADKVLAVTPTNHEMLKILGERKMAGATAEAEDDGLHAEMRLLFHSMHNRRALQYIAISKLSCPYCAMTLQGCGHHFPGAHGKIFPAWLPGKEFMRHGFLRKFLKDDLFREYIALCHDDRAVRHNGIEYTKGELAVYVFLSLGSLISRVSPGKKHDFQKLGLGEKALWNSEDDYASESDDEDKVNHLRAVFFEDHTKRKKPHSADMLRELKQKVRHYGMRCVDVSGDGNCFFNAVVDQLSYYHDVNVNHLELRQAAFNHLLTHYEDYADHIAGTDISAMGDDGTWADHLLILATARYLNMNVAIVQHDQTLPSLLVHRENAAGTLYLGYLRELHYVSLRPHPRILPESNLDELITREPLDDGAGNDFAEVDIAALGIPVVAPGVVVPALEVSALDVRAGAGAAADMSAATREF